MILVQDIETFTENLPVEERVIIRRLRELIFQAHPGIREKLSYGVPYFSLNRRLFFLWPASSIPRLQDMEEKPKVTLGFCYGNLLSNEQGLLVKEGRKQVYTIPIASLASVNEKLLSEIINEAILIDEQFFGRKQTQL
ncbi:MAG: DUF1801 domain-containing protein [Chryseosolibacter sp.]